MLMGLRPVRFYGLGDVSGVRKWKPGEKVDI
jgi:hypothetical protein